MAFVETILGMNRDFFQFWGYIIVFVVLFLESFPLLGAFVPGGMIILLLSGFLARLGFFFLWKIIFVAILASVLIDTTGYFLGRYFSRDFVRRHGKILLIRKDLIDKVGRIVHGHTGKSLIFGRLNPITRSIAPFIVGNERVNFAKFFFYSVVGGVLWVTMFMFAGYIFGNSFQLAQDAERYILWATTILLGGFYAYYLRNMFRDFFSKTKQVVKSGTSSKK